MPLEQGSSRSVIAANIHEMMRNHSHAQAVAAALHTADQAHRMGGIIAHRDDGGGVGDNNDPPDMTDKYNTPLSPQETTAYKGWLAQKGIDPSKANFDYDMQGAFKAGVAQSGNGHFPDTFKKPNHPTFSDQSQYHGIDGNKGGSWGGGQNGQPWTFTPSSTNLQMQGAANLQKYFQKREAGNQLIMPASQASGGIVAHRDDGGVIGNSGVGGFAPSAQNQNPLMQGQIQRYASLPVEKLQELASMLGSSPQGQIVQHLLRQKQTQPNAQQQQAPQAAPQQPAPNLQPTQAQHRGGPVRRAMGGDMGVSPSQATPWWVKSEARTDTGTSPGSGFLSGNTPGRADALHTQAPAGSYILPADVVAGLGEGNSLAGARVVDEMLRTGPGGIPQAPAVRGRTMPQPPRAQAKGGGVQGKGATGKLTPVALSHGEYFVAPEHVMRIGGGNLKSGHRILDHWVQLERERQIKKLKALPPPVGAKKKEAA